MINYTMNKTQNNGKENEDKNNKTKNEDTICIKLKKFIFPFLDHLIE